MMDRCTGVRVLFTGQYWPGANTLYIARAFERCGAIVRVLNDHAIFPDWIGIRGKVTRRVICRSVIEPEWNLQLLQLVEEFAPDLVYITNAHYCWPRTLETIRRKAIPIMCFYHDPQWQRPGDRLRENIPYFNLLATTRSWQEPEFKAAGAQAVSVVRFGYDPGVHRPLEVQPLARERYGAELTFIGTMESQRSAELTALVGDGFPYHFRLWGGLWDRLPPASPVRRYWQGRAIHEQEIPVIYATTRIALHWILRDPHSPDPALRRGDQHNSRTFQIAACGGAMMLAQRTEEHLLLFTENVEAVYFDEVKELREKLDFWLDPTRDEARRQVAAAARARCLKEDYSYVPVVRSFLEYFGLPVSQ